VHIINASMLPGGAGNGSYICQSKEKYGGSTKFVGVDKSAVAIADLDFSNDGNLEMVVGFEDGVIRAFYNNCSLMWEKDTDDEYGAGSDYKVQSSPGIADVDDDCKLEVVIGSGGECDYKKHKCPPFVPNPPPTPSYLYILNAEDGSVEDLGEANGSLVSSPAIGDLDGDSDQEIVIGSDNGYIFAYDVTGYGDAWPSYHQADFYMSSTRIYRRGWWNGNICGIVSGAYSTIETRARITANIKIYVW